MNLNVEYNQLSIRYSSKLGLDLFEHSKELERKNGWLCDENALHNETSPGTTFFGSPRTQSLAKQHRNFGSPSIGNMLNIATSSSFSFALRILSSPTVFVVRCNLLESLSLKASVAILMFVIRLVFHTDDKRTFFKLYSIIMSLFTPFAKKRYLIKLFTRGLADRLTETNLIRSRACDYAESTWSSIVAILIEGNALSAGLRWIPTLARSCRVRTAFRFPPVRHAVWKGTLFEYELRRCRAHTMR